jgi:hypothetical protein
VTVVERANSIQDLRGKLVADGSLAKHVVGTEVDLPDAVLRVRYKLGSAIGLQILHSVEVGGGKVIRENLDGLLCRPIVPRDVD